MRPHLLAATVLLTALALPAFLIGCRRQPAAVTPTVSFARVDAIVKSSGGLWKKVPPADQNYLIQEFGKGNTRLATMVFNRRAEGMVAYRRWMKRIDGMVERSGGNWNKVSQKDRDYLVTIVGKGDEKAAMKTFQERADLKKSKARP